MTDSVDRVRAYYDVRAESEWHRLALPFDGEVEWEIHRRALAEWLPAGARVLDVGGGPGRWAIWLAQRGHRVVLADLSPAQLEIARREIAAAGAGDAIEAVLELDARDLSRFAEASFDAVLSLGPFYHLTEEAGRRRALEEAVRVLRPGGRLFATVMARYSWLLGVVMEAGSARLSEVRALLESGVYRNPEPDRFTEAYLFRPEAVAEFFEGSGLTTLKVLASQGILNLVQDQVAALRERDEAAWEALIEIAYETAADPSIHGLSNHLLHIGEK